MTVSCDANDTSRYSLRLTLPEVQKYGEEPALGARKHENTWFMGCHDPAEQDTSEYYVGPNIAMVEVNFLDQNMP